MSYDVGRRRNFRRTNPRKIKMEKRILNNMSPDRAQIEIGRPAPWPRGKLERYREKKERMRRRGCQRSLAAILHRAGESITCASII